MEHWLLVMAVGDVAIGGGGRYTSIAVPVSSGKEDLDKWLEEVTPMFQGADVTMGNLEGAICEPLTPSEGKSGTGAALICMPHKAADVLKRAGFDVMVLANNHMMDYGDQGILQTLTNLRRVGIVATGGGRNVQEARKPAILERDGVKLALLSYSSVFVPGMFPAGDDKPGIMTVAVKTSYEIPGNILYAPGVPPRIITIPDQADREKMEEDIRQAKSQADIVVVNWHWGLTRYAISYASGLPIEDSSCFVLNYQEELGRAAIDAGADLIIGHHPHRLQGIEIYKGKLIFYSLGILTMPYSMGHNYGEESLIVKAYINRESKELERVTMIAASVPKETLRPRVVPMHELEHFVAELKRLSKKYKPKFRIEAGEIVCERGRS